MSELSKRGAHNAVLVFSLEGSSVNVNTFPKQVFSGYRLGHSLSSRDSLHQFICYREMKSTVERVNKTGPAIIPKRERLR